MININFIRNAIYNCHPSSGASSDYNKGLFVGLVSALMASNNYSISKAIITLKFATYNNNDLLLSHVFDALPDSWNDIWNTQTSAL